MFSSINAGSVRTSLAHCKLLGDEGESRSHDWLSSFGGTLRVRAIPPVLPSLFLSLLPGVVSVSFKRREDGDIIMIARPSTKNNGEDKPYAVDLLSQPTINLRIDTTHVKCSVGRSVHDGEQGVTYKGERELKPISVLLCR